jgi:helicase
MLDLLLAAVSTEDCEPVVPVDFEEIPGLVDCLARERSALLRLDRVSLAETLGVDSKRLLASIRMALIARDWTRLGDASAVADHHGCYPFEVIRLQESVARLLVAMSELSVALTDSQPVARSAHDDEPSRHETIAALLRMVSGGLDERTVTLTYVAGIGPRTARSLRDVGIRDIEDLAAADVDDVAPRVPRVSSTRLSGWIEEASRLVKTRSAFRLRETGTPVLVPLSSWPSQIDPYRLRRALDLEVVSSAPRQWSVAGGLEPHRVSAAHEEVSCDCADAAKGHRCKHVLAVALHVGDSTLRHLANRLTAGSAGTLDLTALWLGRWHNAERRLA